MKYLTDNELFNVFLLCTIIGEFLLPCLLERYYTEYNGKTMVMSALGSSQSPVWKCQEMCSREIPKI